MDLTHDFKVPASVDDAWAAFNDLERIAPCFPGASLTSFDGESFEGLVKVKLGPISLQYVGTGRFVERDEAAHRAVIEAKGKDKRGNGTASATITAMLSSAGAAETSVSVTTDLSVTGKPAQFGRGVMQDVSDRLLGQFATCLETKLGETATPGDGEPASSEPADLGKTGPAASQNGDKLGAQEAPSSTGGSGAAEPAAELDVGTTVLPVLLKRYAPRVIGAIIALWLLRKIFSRQ